MKKREYQRPVMIELPVELEKGFLKASVFEPDDSGKTGVESEGHEIGTEYDFTEESWD